MDTYREPLRGAGKGGGRKTTKALDMEKAPNTMRRITCQVS